MHAVAGEQGAHEEVPLAYVPTGHVVAFKLQEDAARVLYVPAAQGRQVDWPALGLKVPAWQAMHAPPVLLTLANPAAQRLQEDDPAAA